METFAIFVAKNKQYKEIHVTSDVIGVGKYRRDVVTEQDMKRIKKSRNDVQKKIDKGNYKHKEFKGWTKTNIDKLMEAREKIVAKENAV